LRAADPACGSIVIERLIELLHRGITPIVPSRGSVGASGDLAPLAHIALTLIGEGQACASSIPSSNQRSWCCKQQRIEPVTLEAKEGLALINGTHLMAAIGALALCDIAAHAAMLRCVPPPWRSTPVAARTRRSTSASMTLASSPASSASRR
jgi:histidine ammonia-lyase